MTWMAQVVSPMSTVAYVNERLQEGNVVIEGTWTPSDNGNVVIPANTTLKIEGSLDAQAESLTIAAVSSSSLVVTGNYNTSVPSGNINYNVTAGSMNIRTGMSNATVNVTRNMVVEGNATLFGNGKLEIARGVTVTIGGNFLKSGSDTATVEVNGTLEVTGNDSVSETTVNSTQSLRVGGTMSGKLIIGTSAKGYAEVGTMTGDVVVTNGRLVINVALNSSSVSGSEGGPDHLCQRRHCVRWCG